MTCKALSGMTRGFTWSRLSESNRCNLPASAASTKATQVSQHDQIEVMYAQNTPTRSRPGSAGRKRSKVKGATLNT